MGLAPGLRLGSYEGVAAIGAGGMGEVYRARDTRLQRDVAIKVLLSGVADNPDRLARFQREAKTLAALNHPNIAHIHGIEEGPSGPFLVLEFVEGPTLADRLAGGPLSVTDTLVIAKQIAEALEAAHAQGIVHRDLKPANIKLKLRGSLADCTVKVLDFGLAKALRQDAGDDATTGLTMTDMSAATEAGIILGTVAYMSPEQARGETVDKRTDVWAFGCLVFEMLCGRAPFVRRTATDTLAAILTHEPDWAALPAATPASVRRLLQRCLAKDQNRRIRDIGDAALELGDGASSADMLSTPVAPANRRYIPWAVALIALAVASGVTLRNWREPVAPGGTAATFPVRLTVSAPPGHQLDVTSPVGVSRDGRAIAFTAREGATQRIFVRDLDKREAVALPGTEGGFAPFFSPDGQWVGFFAAQKIRKILRSGGAPVAIADFSELAATRNVAANWDEQETILFTPDSFQGIWRVSASGGAPMQVTRPEPGESTHLWPQMLPGGQSIVFSAVDDRADPQAYVQRLDTGERKPLVRGRGTRYVPSGHLVFVQGGSVMAVAFDPATLEFRGSPIPVIPDVTAPFRLRTMANGFFRPFDVSPSGTLAFMSAGPMPRDELVWVDRSGHEEPTGAAGGTYAQPRLSPNGDRIAVVIRSDDLDDVWFYEINRRAWSRFTLEGNSNFPIWTADGSALTYNSDRSGGVEILSRRSDGSAPAETIVPKEFAPRIFPFSSSPDGILAFVALRPAQDIWTVRPGAQPVPLVATPFVEGAPMFAPDGHAIAYVSSETGRNEVYVRPFPGPGEKIPISSQGGNEPYWSPTGRELFYRNGDEMMAVDVTLTPTPRIGTPQRLFQGRYESAVALYANYSTRDGQRFLMVKRLDESNAPTQVNVVVNWFDELTRLVPR